MHSVGYRAEEIVKEMPKQKQQTERSRQRWSALALLWPFLPAPPVWLAVAGRHKVKEGEHWTLLLLFYSLVIGLLLWARKNQNRRNIICTLGEWMPPHQHHAINESGVRLFYDISCCMEKMCPTFFAHWQSARWSRTYGISWNIDVVQNWAFLMPQMPRQGRRDFLAKCRSQNLRTIFRNLSIGLPS